MEETDFKQIDGIPQIKSIIKIIGVGGGGVNAVNYMYRKGINDVTFALCNTGRQALNDSPIPIKIHMGFDRLDAFSPKRCRQDAEESEFELHSMLKDGTKMSLIVAGMGGAIGTGAAPVIARISKELEILTIGIVTLPFKFEGFKRSDHAIEGIEEMAKCVDSLIVINYECLHEIYPEMSVLEAFEKADEVLYMTVKNISEIITIHGLINLDIYDMKSILTDGGVTFIGNGYGEGDSAVKKAIEDAVHSPFFYGNDAFKSKRHLLNITISNEEGSSCLMMEDISYIDEFQAKFGEDYEIMWGLAVDPKLGKRIKATIIATGYDLKDVYKMVPRVLLERSSMHPVNKEQLLSIIGRLKESKTQSDIIYPWEDVLASMIEYPEKVYRSSVLCPNCGEKILKIYFHSPAWTWENLCGRAGDMYICPRCCAQKDFILTRMN